ncbi:MAG: hypothetical protein O2852_04580 [Bacteroidetes bacterium]|jgi:hypothetical protein|nr:hypothetical protein [Bacteroidota bacterium]MDA0980611.1 hypothetical protein [Bacteroidota bacterium]
MIFPTFSVLAARKIVVLSIFFAFAIGASLAQTDAILQVSGTIKDEDSGRKLPGCEIVIFQDGVEFTRLECDKNAGYSIELPIRYSYTFQYERDGFVSKKVVLDVSEIPEGEAVGGFGFDLDMSLFKNIEGFDISILDTPIGMGMYDVNSGKFKFDLDHTDRMKLRIDNERNRLLAIEENRSKNKRAFDVAMKEGENAMKKKKWQEALAHFDEALTLIPDEEEAITERDKARAKLDALADDNDAQEAARAAEEAAAAEALAKENAEKLAEEEDARQRQEEADARRAAADAASSNDVNTDPVPDPIPDPVPDPVEDTADADAASAAADAAARDRGQEAENRALEEQERRESEDADRRDRLAESENKDRAEADERQAQEEADAKRAALLAKSSSNQPDEAEQYFKDALKSESIAIAEELAARVQAENDALRAREEQSRERQRLEQEELEELIQNSKISDSESRSNAEAIMARRNELFSVVKDYDHSVSQEVGEMYEGDAAAHKQKIQDVEFQIHDKSDRQKGDLDQRRVDSESRNYDAVVRIYDLSDGTSQTDNGEPYLADSDVDLPQGLYESSYKIQNGIVIERSLRSGDKVIHYRKVMMKTGTYYFREGVSITSAIWRLETTYVHD